MPVISTFFGIIIRMFYREHEPAHFHAEHAGQQATFDLTGGQLAGRITSRRARRRIQVWAQQHEPELRANWERMTAGQPLESIAPLSEDRT